MKFKEFISRLFGKSAQGTTQQAPNPAPSPQHSTPNPSASVDSGQRERHVFMFQQVRADSVFPDSTETWQKSGNTLEGCSIDMLAITASGQIVEAATLKSICSICHHAEDTTIRSDVSQRTLCRTCLRTFTAPDGKELTVSPDEHARLTQDFNTWEHFDRVNPQLINPNG